MKWFKHKAKTTEQSTPGQTPIAANAPLTSETTPVPATAPETETALSADVTTPFETTAATRNPTTTAPAAATIAVNQNSSEPRAGAPTKPRPALEVLRLDERRQNGALVVRAELPGLDPDKDIRVTVANGRVQIDVERRDQDEIERNGYRVQELRYGRFSHSMRLDEGVETSAITATYNDGVLEVRVPEPVGPQATQIPITSS